MLKYTTENIFDKTKKANYPDFLELVNSIEPINIENLTKDFKDGQGRKEMCEKWVDSLENNKPDYSLYSSPYYLNEAFDCWKTYSRDYINSIKKYLTKENCSIDASKVHNILDLGCGIAFSTIALKSVFPNAKVMATNLKDTLQYKIDLEVTKDIEKIEIHDESEVFNLGKIDMVFASEFFEHLTKPFEYLRKIIDTYRPEYIIFANTFGQMATGHFKTYYDKENALLGKDASYRFSEVLKDNGYNKDKNVKFYNSRPNIYIKKKMEDNI